MLNNLAILPTLRFIEPQQLRKWYDTDGMVDVIVGGVGTGGTLTGVEILKSRKQNFKVVAVEPEDSSVLSGEALDPQNTGIGVLFLTTKYRNS